MSSRFVVCRGPLNLGPQRPGSITNKAPQHGRSAPLGKRKQNERDHAAVRRTSPVDRQRDTLPSERLSREIFRIYEKLPFYRVLVQAWIARLLPATASHVKNPNNSGLAPAPTNARQCPCSPTAASATTSTHRPAT